MGSPVLELKDATVIKGDRAVLDALTLTIEEGEHTAIVGPNGAGKSLLVKLLTHEVRALVTDNGQSTVRVFGSDNWDVFDLRSQLGIVSADLHQRFRRWLDELSSGEARRVLLARALVTSPRALVLDEPTTGLDLAARHDFMERVRQIARDGTTLILITHHIDEIVPEIQRVILLREGRIAAAGPKASVLTSKALTELFGAPIAIEDNGGYYYGRRDER